MPDPALSPLTVAVCEGAALAMVLVRRGRSATASLALQAQCGIDLPLPGRLCTSGGDVLVWNGPDRFLAIREAGGFGLARELGVMLNGLANVVEASSSRSVLSVSGELAAEWLNRLLPIDLHPRAFPHGSVALTVGSHMPVQIWRPDADSFRLACASSLAASFRRQLDVP